MKAIGITVIVFGHFASPHNVYAYVFSVPLFFLISICCCYYNIYICFFSI